MAEAFINNILDSSETITEEELRDLFNKKLDKVKEENKKKYSNILETFNDKLKKEQSKYNNLLAFIEGGK